MRHAAVLCSRNAHKLDELAALLESFDLTAVSADVEMPEETGSTFVENAELKARAGAAAAPGAWSIADDSGLCVDALDGAPGVHSARFAGEDATDSDNTDKLLQSLESLEDLEERNARFVCVLVGISPTGLRVVAEGSVEGHIALERAGDTGFGYDPVFIPEGHDRTFAQLGSDVKSQLSHRARAARDFALQVAMGEST